MATGSAFRRGNGEVGLMIADIDSRVHGIARPAMINRSGPLRSVFPLQPAMPSLPVSDTDRQPWGALTLGLSRGDPECIVTVVADLIDWSPTVS